MLLEYSKNSFLYIFFIKDSIKNQDKSFYYVTIEKKKSQYNKTAFKINNSCLLIYTSIGFPLHFLKLQTLTIFFKGLKTLTWSNNYQARFCFEITSGTIYFKSLYGLQRIRLIYLPN